jgi:hypothetical protein
MTRVEDRRFDQAGWPIEFEIAAERADTWLQYLSVESQKRGWGVSGMGQMGARENSGSQTLTAGSEERLVLVWERKRIGQSRTPGSLKIKARYEGLASPSFDAREFLEHVNKLCIDGVKERVHCRGQLEYEGLSWLGELWLDDSVRLSAPTKQDETALFGPRIVIVDAEVLGIDRSDAFTAFNVKLRELSVFLSVVTRQEFQIPRSSQRAWTWTQNNGQVECDVRWMGYVETSPVSAEMPKRDLQQPVPTVAVQRPDFSERAIVVGRDTELTMPADVLELWRAFSELPLEPRKQFLQVATMWQLALSLGHANQTAAFTWMVAACEALKPSGPQYFDHNIYHVIEALLSSAAAKLLQEEWFRPQDIRNAHLHRGEFRGSEFADRRMMSSRFYDPTFDNARRVLGKLAPAAIVEWLRRGGLLALAPLRRQRTWRRWVRQYAVMLLCVLGTAGIATGMAIGWFLGKAAN